MSKFSQLQVALDLLKRAKTQTEWSVTLKMICSTFTISELEIIEQDITRLEKKGKFKTCDAVFEKLHA